MKDQTLENRSDWEQVASMKKQKKWPNMEVNSPRQEEQQLAVETSESLERLTSVRKSFVGHSKLPTTPPEETSMELENARERVQCRRTTRTKNCKTRPERDLHLMGSMRLSMQDRLRRWTVKWKS